MTALVLCSFVFLVLTTVTVSVALSKTTSTCLTSRWSLVAVSFVLASTLGFILTNKLLEVPNPIILTVTIILAGAVFLELAQFVFIKEKAALTDIVCILVGTGLFFLSRYIMHEIGTVVVDQFETLID